MKKDKIIYRIINGKGENRRLDKRSLVLGLFVFMTVATFSFFFTRNMGNASAVDLSQFKAGNIMSDVVMRNYNSMSESDIQAFLKAKGSCNVSLSEWRSKLAGSPVGNYSEVYPPYTWHVVNGKFVCLADENINGESAAHIIYQAAQDYHINPQVLIVLLQKEQGLITDGLPNSFQYRSATGYGCPDTAKCSSTYYGFKNQVRNAASLFNTVLSGGWTNYPVGWNEIRYSPNAACGSSRVYVENLATSALYRYTPYQPNAGALAAGTGTAACGAYGNRNFYIYFSDWFGSTQVAKSNVRDLLQLGSKVSEQVALEEDNSIKVTQYQYGVKFGNDYIGYFSTKNAVFNKWKQNRSLIGNPISSWEYNAETGIEWQYFANGAIVGSDTKGWFISMGKSRRVWQDHNFEFGDLGWPTSDILTNTQTGISFQYYENGAIVGNDTKGWFVSMGKSREVWQRNGFESGVLGFPTSDFQENKWTGIKWQDYEGGKIVGNDEKGWFVSVGKSREVWQKYDGVKGILGWPTSDLQKNATSGIEWQDYEGGKIVGNDKKGWFISMGKSREVWVRNNWEFGILGFPTSDFYENKETGIKWQDYEGGKIVGNDEKGWFISAGKSREVWQRNGFELGILGFPTSDFQRNAASGMEWQDYEGGKIIGNDQMGWFISYGKIREKWVESGWEFGKYGWPQSDVIDGKQKYTGGWIYE